MALKHGIFYGGLKSDGEHFLGNLPDIVENVADKKSGAPKTTKNEEVDDQQRMQIAWRYQNQQPKTPGQTGNPNTKHSFNLQKNISAEKMAGTRTTFWPGSKKVDENVAYHDLFRSIQTELSAAGGCYSVSPQIKEKNLLRIGLEQLGSLNFGEDTKFEKLGTFLIGKAHKLTHIFIVREL